MPIPESQLQTWSHQGSMTQSSITYNTIKNVLEAGTTPYEGKDYKVFLQGSYGNDTNIFAESDVDIVIQLDDCVQSDLSELSDSDRVAYNNAFADADYTYVDFKRDVLSVLTAQYGSAVKAGDKAVAIDAGGSRRKADVLAAIQFRRYYKFRTSTDSSYDEGICFYNSAGNRIVNFPKQHSANMTSKHQATSLRLKPMARVLKNMRSRLVADGHIEAGIAPSYFLEGLLYNLPDADFTAKYEDCVFNLLKWYGKSAEKDKLVCANEQYYLIRDALHTCWPQANCDAFVQAAISLWNDW